MIRITSFATLKGNGGNNSNGNGNNEGGTTNVTNITTGVQGVNIWGQYHDHSKDISGDMTNVGNITADGRITTTNDIQGRNITATNNLISNQVITGNINSSGDLTVVNIDASGAIHADGNIGTDSNLSGRNIYADEDIICENLEAGNGNISNLESIHITTEFLTVTKAAHFYKLIIDEIRSTEGQILVTPANSGEGLVHVEQDGNYYILYFLAHDMSTGKKINNSFDVGDQILCQTFNAATGLQYDASNRFYWTLCTQVSSKPVSVTVNNANQECHWVKVDWTDKDQGTNCTPAVGDEIVSLGNRTDTTRQACISIGAYNNPYLDSGIHAPFIIQYDGINDYNLSSHRKNVISNGYNQFFGTFTTTTGDDIEDLINDAQQGAITYMHTAYANSNDGSVGFSKTYFQDAYYIGFCSNHTQSDAALTRTDYTWCRLRGSNGTSANNYLLQSTALAIHVDEDNTSSDDDFTVRGYTFVNDTKTEINNNCKVTYVYSTHADDVYQRRLPITISPYQEEQNFSDGLISIRFDMLDVDDEETVAQLEIPIIKNGATGQDLEEYKLIPIREEMPIDKNGTLGILLQYNVMHIVGGNYQTVTSDYEHSVWFRPHYQQSTSMYTGLSRNVMTPSFQSASYQTNYNTSTNKLLYIDVVLANRHPDVASEDPLIIYDKRIVYATLAPSASFSITDEIKGVVQGHTSDINGLTNSVSTITQQYNQISSTVESHTTLINNIDGRVTTNETNISNITQRADSIESTVQNLKTSAKNLFNFTYCRWMNAVPFIQAYGIEGKSTLCRISRLGFDGIGGDFTVSCWMRMKTTNTDVNVNVCDVRDQDQRTVRVTTDWSYYQFHFHNVTNYIGDVRDTSNYNGFLDFESDDITNTNRLYVREIMVTRGTVPCDFAVSWKDLENPNTDNIIDWTYDTDITQTSEIYKGYPVYQPLDYPQGDGAYKDFIFATNKSLKTNTPYTLSFYAKAEYTEKIEAFLHENGGCVDGTCQMINNIDQTGTTSIANFPNGHTIMHIGTTWQRYIIHWYNQNSGNRSIIAYRDSVDNWDDIDHEPNISIAGVEFREGYWDKDLLNSQSLIRQTASEIELKVNNTGINIEDGSITLNANNTTVIGNLNLRDSKQGLIIYDSNNAPRISIQSQDLGNLDTSTFGIDDYYQTRKTTKASGLTFDNINIGNFTAGQKIEISLAQVNQNGISTFLSTATLTYQYQILRGTTVVKTISGQGNATGYPTDINGYPCVWKLNPTTYNVTTSGTYYIKCQITPNGLNSPEDIEFIATFYLKKSQANIQKIGLDGAVFAHNATDYNWFGADKTELSKGNAKITLDSNGALYKPINTTNPCELGSVTNVSTILTNISTYNATLNEGCIVVMPNSISQTLTIQLPQASQCNGKYYFIKNLTNQTVRVTEVGHTSSYTAMVKYDSRTPQEYVSVEARPSIFISCGLYWLEFFC